MWKSESYKVVCVQKQFLLYGALSLYSLLHMWTERECIASSIVSTIYDYFVNKVSFQGSGISFELGVIYAA